MKSKIIAAIVSLLLYSATAAAQNVAPNLETILSETNKQTEFYRETFRNLLADETKTFEEYDKTGALDERTIVKSTFLVYQSGRNAQVTSELRNVLEVNGKAVPNGSQRSNDFLAELEKETTLEKELRKIQKEGARYDKTLEVSGLTLKEGTVLAPNMRPFFDYQLAAATENSSDGEMLVINYRQTKKSPFIVVDGKERFSDQPNLYFQLDLPNALKKNDVFLRGRLWIDAKTFQIRREEQILSVQTAEPLDVLTTDFEYQNSNYEILVPKTITVVFNELKKQKGGDRFAAQKDVSLRFDYSNFRQTGVEVKIIDEEN